MPLQNRVTPFGDIVAIAQRGLFTGNRGIIHDPATRTLTRRRWTTKAWIVCRLDFRGRRREVMSRRSWTELFFLDEATALAAGHRPCFYCRRPEAEGFRAAWASRGGALLRAGAMDEVLHRERLVPRDDPSRRLTGALDDLPDGAMLHADGEAFVVARGRLRPWTAAGYGGVVDAPANLMMLTPPSTLAALRGGYRPVIHPSAMLERDAGPSTA